MFHSLWVYDNYRNLLNETAAIILKIGWDVLVDGAFRQNLEKVVDLGPLVL